MHNSGSVWKDICLVKSSSLFLRRFIFTNKLSPLRFHSNLPAKTLSSPVQSLLKVPPLSGCPRVLSMVLQIHTCSFEDLSHLPGLKAKYVYNTPQFLPSVQTMTQTADFTEMSNKQLHTFHCGTIYNYHFNYF